MLGNEISEEIRQKFYEIFGSSDNSDIGRHTIPKFLMIRESGEVDSNFSDEMKCKSKEIICPNRVNESDLLHLRISESMNEGWAFTKLGFHIKTLEHNLYTSYEDFTLSVKPNIDLNREDIMSVACSEPKIGTINDSPMFKVNAYGIIYNENQENDGLLLFNKILDYDNVRQPLDEYLKCIRQILINNGIRH